MHQLFGLKKQFGLSLIELMVAMLLGLFLMTAVVQVTLNSKSAFTTEKELAALQESARYASEYVAREIRMAGYQGCSTSTASIANAINNSASSWSMMGPGLQGYEHEAGTNNYPSDFGTIWPNTDAIVIRRGDISDLSISSHNPNAASIHLSANHDIKQGEIIMIANTDCTQVGVFQMTNTNNNNTISVIDHGTGNSATPGNCTKKLGGNFNCAGSSEPASAANFAYPKGSSVMRMRSTAFYVAASSMLNTVPALYARRLAATAGATSSAAEELVAGVENMQVFYGIDTNSDSIADRYAKANSTLLNTAAKWKNVVSIRISLRMRSINPIYPKNVAYGAFENIAGTNGSDRFLRKDITTTVRIRNQGTL
jgi:type IV pilus assembly protein PilW